MEPTSPFAVACQAWIDLVHRAHELPLPTRVEALTSHVAHLYAAGLRLPPCPQAQPPAEPLPWPDPWPGVGPHEGRLPTVSFLLEGLTSDLSRGLAADPQTAERWWAHAFEARWGTLAVAALARLHNAVRTERAAAISPSPAAPPPPVEATSQAPVAPDSTPMQANTQPPTAAPPADPVPLAPAASGPAQPPRPQRPRPADPTLVERGAPGELPALEPARPTRQRTLRARGPSTDTDGILGIRFEVVPDGLHVTDIHPAGPAAGALQPGDRLVSLDGLPLRGRTEDALRAAMSGPAGVTRSFQVARGAGLLEIQVVPVTAEALASAPLVLQLLVLDTDAVNGLLARLEPMQVLATEDPDQPGLLHLHGPAEASARVHALLEVGEVAGWWECL